MSKISISIIIAFEILLSACAPAYLKSGEPMISGGAGGHPSAENEYDTPPRLIEGNAPIHDRRRAEGRATIRFTIAEDGSTKDFEVLSADDDYYANHAIAALKLWRYQPATKGGKPISLTARQTFNYVYTK